MSRNQKINAFMILLVTILNSLLELFGIASVTPVVNILQAQNLTSELEFAAKVNQNFFSKWVCKIFNINVVTSNASKIITVMLIIIIVFYIVKASYSILVSYLSSLFGTSLSRSVSTKLIKANLSMPYDYFINTNSAIIMRKCTSDVGTFGAAVSGVISVINAFLTTIVIFVFLMIQSWMITLIFTLFMIICACLSVFLLKNVSVKMGKKMQRFNAKNVDILHKSIYGIKETKISEKDNYFADQYFNNRLKIDSDSIRYGLIKSLPSRITQNVGIILVMVATMFLVIYYPKEKSTYIITFLTTFVLAAIKLLPNINSISGNIISFSYFKPSVDLVFDDLEEAKEIENQKFIKAKKFGSKPINFKSSITIKHLTFSYKKSSIILSDVNLIIYKGEYVAFSGDSGAGKTTLIDNLLGLLTPQKGDIKCDNRSIYENIKSWHSLLSYVPQTIFLLDDTVKANVCFGLKNSDIDENKVWEALEKAQLKKFVMTLPNKLNTKIGEAGVKLSGGQRQRIGIARAFYRDTPIMVLDEATSALDYKTEDNILLNIRKVKGDKTVIIITHRLNTISHCDKIFSIENHLCTQIK